jgi:hypothetical protein
MEQLTSEEKVAVKYSVRNSIDLYRRYVKLRPEDTKMKRRQTVTSMRLTLLRSALRKLS